MIRYLLDSDICIEALRGRGGNVLRRLREHREVSGVGMSTVALAELEVGVAKSARREQAATALKKFCAPLIVVPFDVEAARTYGMVRADLERMGQRIGHVDLLIAAHALSIGATLVTNNYREFSRVADLHVENWL